MIDCRKAKQNCGSPVLSGKKLKHKGHHVHKGKTRRYSTGFFLRDLCVLCGKKDFPVKNGRAKIA
jgi:hypothetical protein